MAAAASWVARVREQTVEARDRSVRAAELLAAASAGVASPMLTADSEGGRTRSQLVRDVVAVASAELAFAASAMKEAELLACRGAAANPMAPLPSVDHIPPGYRYVGLALRLLQTARVCAGDACNVLVRCCERLCTASILLEHPDLPSVDTFVGTELLAAHVNLQAVRHLAGVSATLANTADWMMQVFVGVN
ncbi:hypothetical protein GQ55_5G484800 [Panicum hallii var. hallii]|uniref:Uncharacterized protein n=1 Tax=Panicum hallii var. hallii TaxID=1504633 RepID=A0A2T7DRB7_9POAL|nr:hypothetical protein GQ55_5G484800 [Panicum hallii var. hallii]